MLLSSRGPISIYTNRFTGADGGAPADFTNFDGTTDIQSNALRTLTGASAYNSAGMYCTKLMPKDYDLRVDATITTVTASEFYGAINVRAGSTTVTDIDQHSSWHCRFVGDGTATTGYSVLYRISGAGAETFLTGGANIGFVQGTVLHVRIRLLGSVFKMRYWKDSEVEPTAWNMNFDDAGSAPTGTANSLSLACRNGNNATADDWRWKNLVIQDMPSRRVGGYSRAIHSARM